MLSSDRRMQLMTSLSLKEIIKLRSLCEVRGFKIEYRTSKCIGFGVLLSDDQDRIISDAIISPTSLGHEDGLLELMWYRNDGTDQLEGYLTAAEVFEKWACYLKLIK